VKLSVGGHDRARFPILEIVKGLVEEGKVLSQSAFGQVAEGQATGPCGVGRKRSHESGTAGRD